MNATQARVTAWTSLLIGQSGACRTGFAADLAVGFAIDVVKRGAPCGVSGSGANNCGANNCGGANKYGARPGAKQKSPAMRRAFVYWWRGQDLNLRPSGYEPDELPDCSTPRLRRKILAFFQK